MQPLAAQFQAYVQQLTGLILAWSGGPGVALPAYLRQRYEGRLVTVAGQLWLVAFFKGVEPLPPLQLREQLERMAARSEPTPAGICLVAEQLPPYLRRRLVELQQPFVIPGRQLFWPALGSAETVQRPQRLRPRRVELGPIAQQLLIALVLRRLLAPVTINAVAAALGCTAASVSQSVKALEGSDLISSQVQGRERVLELREAPHATWQRAEALLRSPVRRRLRVMATELPDEGEVLAAGESALATLTDLGAPAEPTIAVTSRVWNQHAIAPAAIPTPDLGTCVVELWRYPPEATATRGTVDPLSLFLSLREIKDERVQSALTQLLEQLPW